MYTLCKKWLTLHGMSVYFHNLKMAHFAWNLDDFLLDLAESICVELVAQFVWNKWLSLV